MAAERRRAARLDGAHHPELDAAEVTGMRLTIRFAMAAEDVRHLQSRQPWRPLSRAARPPATADRAGSACADRFGGDPGVARRASEAGVAEQDLDDAHVRPALQEMGREAVPQRVHRHPLAQASRRAG